MQLGPILLQRELVADPVATEMSASLERARARVGSFLDPIAGAAPGPPTLLVDAETMDQLHVPRRLHGPDGRGRLEQNVVPGITEYIALGVCALVDATVTQRLRESFEVPPPRGALLVALCPARIRSVARKFNHDDLSRTHLAELVWLHELLHWSHGALSQIQLVRPAEEAMVQIVLARLLRTHPQRVAMTGVMDWLSARQPPEYGAYRELETRAAVGDEPLLQMLADDCPFQGVDDSTFSNRMRQKRAAETLSSRMKAPSTTADHICRALWWSRSAGVRPLAAREIADALASLWQTAIEAQAIAECLDRMCRGKDAECFERFPGERFQLSDVGLRVLEALHSSDTF